MKIYSIQCIDPFRIQFLQKFRDSPLTDRTAFTFNMEPRRPLYQEKKTLVFNGQQMSFLRYFFFQKHSTNVIPLLFGLTFDGQHGLDLVLA